MTASDHVRVVLEDVASTLSGSYLCEVTVTPTFFALAEAANMTVIGENNCKRSFWQTNISDCKATFYDL